MNSDNKYFYLSTEWKTMRAYIMELDNNTCQICGSKNDLCVDHINPISKSGIMVALHPFNLRTLCRTCNLEKSDDYIAERELPIIIERLKNKINDIDKALCFYPHSRYLKIKDVVIPLSDNELFKDMGIECIDDDIADIIKNKLIKQKDQYMMWLEDIEKWLADYVKTLPVMACK